MSQPLAQKTIHLSTEMGLANMYFLGNEIFANPSTPPQLELVHKYWTMSGCYIEEVQDDFHRAMQKGPPRALLVMYPSDQNQEKSMSAFQELSKDMTLMNFGWFLEILHLDVNKGEGLGWMCKHLEIGLQDCIAIGDGTNDLEFLEMAGTGYAMKNAPDTVKEIADDVIAYTNDEDGVIKTLQQLENKGLLIFEPLESRHYFSVL